MIEGISVPMSRPTVKPEHSPYRIAADRIRIGGDAYGLAAEIADPGGWVWTMLAMHPALLPGYRVLVWSPRVGLVLAVNVAIAWLITALHELGHLATARAAGAPARMTLSTRLQFLVAQTDVSGVWAAPRRTRMTVYLAGIAVQVGVAGCCLLVLGAADPPGIVRKLLAVTVTEARLEATTPPGLGVKLN